MSLPVHCTEFRTLTIKQHLQKKKKLAYCITINIYFSLNSGEEGFTTAVCTG